MNNLSDESNEPKVRASINAHSIGNRAAGKYSYNLMQEARMDDDRLAEIGRRRCDICGGGGAFYSVKHKSRVCFKCEKLQTVK